MTLISATRDLQRGFTLLELMLVLVILGFAGVLIAPTFSTLETRSFNAQVREAATLLNYARRTAVVQGHPARATLRLRPQPEQAEAAPARVGDTGYWSSDGIDMDYRDSTGQRVEVTDAVEITFYPEGGSSGGELILSQGERMAALQIDPFSGRVSTRFDEDISR